ncbi:MAG TPA: DUF222 domain-containing protein, partial [Polyangiaceae bacterium]|nr:DUF222 domain-containing protein [Polyangiaceae bacterium]
MASVRVAVTALLALDPAAVDGGEGPAIHAELRAAVDQLSMFSARLLARVEADGRWAAGGERTFGDWMARRHHTSTGAVRRDVALGHALEEVLPGAAAAVAAGSVSLEHARVLAQVAPSSPARVAAL